MLLLADSLDVHVGGKSTAYQHRLGNRKACAGVSRKSCVAAVF
jgi:hypothetical protein